MQQPKKGTVKKNGTTIVKGSRPNMGVFKTEITKTGTGLFEPYEQKTTSIDTTGYSKGKPSFTVVTKKGTGDKTSGGPKITSVSKTKIPRSQVPSTLKSLQKKKKGGVIKSKRK
jgi:hypothetical protein